MWEWITSRSTEIDLALNGIMVLVWLVYLQLFLVTFLRQTRTEILISTGAGRGLNLRCFVSNLGMEPIYVSDIVLCLRGQDGETRAFVTDRDELRPEDLHRPGEATNQGPLRSAQSADIGSFADLLGRARGGTGLALDPGSLDCLEVVVVASAASNATLIAAKRRFTIEGEGDTIRVKPATLRTRQIRSLLARRRLQKELQARL
ncbi:hypothetical protein ACFQXB_10660 [Plastorhodobacter daqingensis]|uniref:Uncharacterized protein n=1 Tax=Plastorhodobacter daqingensis TaxID=1387281 RepID=A0ABW2UMF0_9RHOB